MWKPSEWRCPKDAAPGGRRGHMSKNETVVRYIKLTGENLSTTRLTIFCRWAESDFATDGPPYGAISGEPLENKPSAGTPGFSLIHCSITENYLPSSPLGNRKVSKIATRVQKIVDQTNYRASDMAKMDGAGIPAVLYRFRIAIENPSRIPAAPR